MLYSILRFLFKITGHVFFRNITIRNKQLISDKGPLIIVANHPSAFMDPIVMATMFNRKLYFLGKGILFKSKFAKWILPKFNTIPIYRQADDPSEMRKNEDTFRACYKYLEEGCAILIFPEGITKTERKLREIKTGAARIALGAEAKNNFTLNIQIVTVGLNYSNPHKFNRDLFINIAEPISLVDYKDAYKTGPVKTVQQITELIRIQLEKHIIAISDEKIDALSGDIEYLYKNKLSKELGIAAHDQNSSFLLTKKIISAVAYFMEKEPERAEKMALRIKQYHRNLNAIGLQDADISQGQNRRSGLYHIKSLILILAGFPIFLYGGINNYLPFKIPGIIANRMASRREFIGAIGMAAGLFTFLIFYSLQITFFWKFSRDTWLTFLYAFSLPVSGLFAYSYYYTIEKIKARWSLIYIFSKKSVFISNLISERENIIKEFDKARSEFNTFRNSE